MKHEQPTRKSRNNSSNTMYSIDSLFTFFNENKDDMKNKLLIPAMIISFILGLLVTEIVCKPETIVKKKSVRKQWTRTKPLAATIHYSDTTYIKTYFPDTVWQVITQYDTIYTTLQDYFAYVNVKDTIPIDTIGHLYLNDSLHQNRIFYRGYELDIEYYTHVLSNKNIISGSYSALYSNFDTTNIVGLNIALERNKTVFSFGYGKDPTRLFEKNNDYYMFTLGKTFEIKKPLLFRKK